MNYSSSVSTVPVRGSILDRNGVVLADSTVSYAVAILPKSISNSNITSEELFTRLNQYINLTELDKKKYLFHQKTRKGQK